MSLTADDLLQIRQLFDEAFNEAFDTKLAPIKGELTALRNDIKELYDMVADLQNHSVTIGASFRKLPVKEQILQLNAAVIALAQKEGVTLPR